jgi:amidase
LIGGLIPRALVEQARAREPQIAARYNAAFADHDVLLTPVIPAPAPELGIWEGRGWLRTSTMAGSIVPYCVPWNVTGQPAASVPAGFAADGLPRSVQLVGHPNGEATLLSLAAQIEAERPWAQDRPSGFS